MADPVSTRPLLDKLGVRVGARVAIVGAGATSRPAAGASSPGEDPFDELRGRLADRTTDVTELGPDDVPPAGTALVFLAVDAVDDLFRLGALRAPLVLTGAIWVVSRKGRAATIRDTDVMAAARAVGLVDNKVVAFSSTHTSIRLVIPLALRPR